MNRTRIVFAVIVLAAVGVIALAALSQNAGTSVSPAGPGVQEALPGNAVRVLVQTANTKELWMDAMAEQFNAADFTLESGESVYVEVRHTGSGLHEDIQPTAWSPANQVWVDMVNQDWRDRTNQPLITEACPGTVSIPIGIAMWRPMAEALGWPNDPISWSQLTELAIDPDGWASLGHPEWGTFRYGHGHPDYSNSGRLSIVAEIYASKGSTEQLTYEDVWAEQTLADVGAVQTAVYHYGKIDTDLLDRMVNRGPSYLHGVTNYEGNVLRWNAEYADQLRFPFVLVYPSDGTFWMDHPLCLLDNADWVTDEQVEGARLFQEFILEREQQTQLISTGIRPAMEGIDLTSVEGSPFSLENGVIPTITKADVPVLPYPTEDVMRNVIDMWFQVKKPATIVVVLDVSGSMEGEPMRAAAEGAEQFIAQMQPNDEVVVIAFNHDVYQLEPSGMVGEVGEELRETVSGLIADGGTALYHVVIESLDEIDQLQKQDLSNDEQRIYSIVLMTDGENYANDGVTESQMFSHLPDGTEASQVHIYTIAYGDGANQTLLQSIANRTNGKFFAGTVEDIQNIYFLISSEF
jgi:Ca-activated chloride channel family protein